MNSVDPSSRPTAGPLPRRLTAAVTVALLAISGALLPVESARADTVTVTTPAELRTAVTTGCASATAADPRLILIGGNSSWGALYDSTITYVSCHVRIDLQGRAVNSGAIALRDGTSMHLMSSLPGGRLSAYADYQSQDPAGIRTTNATLTIDGVTVRAQGAVFGAGIGGGGVSGYGNKTGEAGGTVHITNGAHVTAYGSRGAGIGGGTGYAGSRGTGHAADSAIGRGGNGGTLVVSGANTKVYASSELGAGIGGGNGAGGNRSATGGRGGIGGTVTIIGGAFAEGTSVRGAGVGGGTGTGYGTTYSGRGGQVVVENATLSAASTHGAGIGSGDSSDIGAHGGSLEIRAGATVSSAAWGAGGAFGTGRRGANGDSDQQRLTIAAQGVFNVWNQTNSSALRLHNGRATIAGTLAVHTALLTVDSTDFTVAPSGRIVATAGTINGSGRIVNEGVIRANAVTGVTVQRNNFPLRFHHANGSTHDVRIYAPNVTAAGATLPAPAAGLAWNSVADGSGQWFNATTPVVPALMTEPEWETNAGGAVQNLWASIAPDELVTIQITAPGSVTAGQWFTIDAELQAAFSPTPLATTADFHLEPMDSGVEHSAGQWRVVVAGQTSILVTITYEGQSYASTVTLDVAPGPLATLTLDAPEFIIDGSTVDFTARGFDAWNNEVALPSAGLSSSNPADVVAGLGVTFTGAGARELELSVTGSSVTATSTVNVLDESARYHLIVLAPETVSAGESFDLEIVLHDRVTETDIDDPDSLTLSLNGSPVTPGTHVLTTAGSALAEASAEYGGHSFTASRSFEVVPGAAHTLAVTPSLTTVYRGANVTFTVTGVDAYGNDVDTSAATLVDATSGSAASVVRTLTFDGLGDATVRASLGSASVDSVVRVRPDPARTVIELLDGAGSSTAGQSVPLRVVVKDSVTDEVYPLDVNDVAWSSTSGSLVDRGDETGIETRAGSHVQRASVDFWGVSLEATRAWAVAAAGPAHLTLNPSRIDTLDGRAHAFSVSATDAYGNAAATTGLALASTRTADSVSGLNVTFHGAGTRYVSASVASATATAEVRVAALPTSGGVLPAGDALSASDPSGASDPSNDEGAASDGTGPTAPDSGAPGSVGSDSGAGDDPAASDRDTVDDDAASASDAASAWWLWILIVVGAAVLAGALTFALRRRSRAI